MPISRKSAAVAPAANGHGPQPRRVAIPPERRALIEAHVALLSATARKVAAELPLTADVTDYAKQLDAAGRGGDGDA